MIAIVVTFDALAGADVARPKLVDWLEEERRDWRLQRTGVKTLVLTARWREDELLNSVLSACAWTLNELDRACSELDVAVDGAIKVSVRTIVEEDDE